MKRRKTITLFGNFGLGNLGNECTLEAMLYHVRRHLPDAEVRCICSGPEHTSSTYNIAAASIRETPLKMPPRPKQWVLRLVKWIFIGVPIEMYRCGKALWTLKSTDVLVMTGTGMLEDFGILPFDLHYDILRWSVLAKLCRCKLLFVSVGAGPLHHTLSRYFVKWALSMADYRSYRNSFSKQYLESIGFETRNDSVYPDLVFSLPSALMPAGQERDHREPVVGVGLMTFYEKCPTLEPSEAVYHDYVATLAAFVTWLLEHGYTVRLLIGDVVYDRRVKHDLRALLKERQVRYQDERLLDDPITSAEQVLTQIATADVVVASRFHNIVLALMLAKPVVSIGYHVKVTGLMGELGLGAYCNDIDHLDLSTLIGQFNSLEENAEKLRPQIKQKTEAYRHALDNQYERICQMVAS